MMDGEVLNYRGLYFNTDAIDQACGLKPVRIFSYSDGRQSDTTLYLGVAFSRNLLWVENDI